MGLYSHLGGEGSNISIHGTGFKIISEPSAVGGPTYSEAVFYEGGFGPNLIVDGGFNDNTYWDDNVLNGVTQMPGGIMEYLNVNDGINAHPNVDIYPTENTTYRVELDIKKYNIGSVKVKMGSQSTGAFPPTVVDGDGTYYEDILVTDTTSVGRMVARDLGGGSGTRLHVLNISIRAHTSGSTCVGIKNMHAASVQIQAHSIIGDHLSIDGKYDKADPTKYVEIPFGDIIHGRFDRVSLLEPDSGTSAIQLIKGG